MFRPLVDNLLQSDPFLVLADYAAYVACQERVSAAWQRSGALDAHVDPQHRARRASSPPTGRSASTASEIWNVAPVRIALDRPPPGSKPIQ